MGDERSDRPSAQAGDFDERLRRARKANEEKNRPAQSGGSAMGIAFRIAADLVVAVAVGTAIGYGLDQWLGTKPWMMLVFFMLGSAAGVLNVIRIANATAESARITNAKDLPRIEDDDDD
jgi:ATP synthase protein I